MLRIFIGRDERQPVAVNVLSDSIARHASVPVAITPLSLKALPITRHGLTAFTFSRFLVPYLCEFKGTALFLDADMVVTADIADLFAQANGVDSVQVNRNQPRFEWPSAMLFNCEHCTALTPEYVQDPKNQLFDFAWAKSIGEFSPEWNHCVSYGEPWLEAKLYHFTAGLPVWRETRGQNPEDVVFHDAMKRMMHTCSYQELMGLSVHAQRKAS